MCDYSDIPHIKITQTLCTKLNNPEASLGRTEPSSQPVYHLGVVQNALHLYILHQKLLGEVRGRVDGGEN
jgi:hypothetical protein